MQVQKFLLSHHWETKIQKRENMQTECGMRFLFLYPKRYLQMI